MPVSGFQTLPESLASLLAPETLSGSNSLACEYCGTKTEAERQLRLASTPPLLCISLQRFVFDYRVRWGLERLSGGCSCGDSVRQDHKTETLAVWLSSWSESNPSTTSTHAPHPRKWTG